MNEEAIQDGYNYFVQTGYNGTIEDYQQLLQENNEAFNDTYKYFVNTGYNGTVEEFQVLVGTTAGESPEKKNFELTGDHVEEMLVSGIPPVEGVPGKSESSNISTEQAIDQNEQPAEGDPQPQSEQDIDQNEQPAEGDVNPNEQDIDQPQEEPSNQQKIDQEVLDRWAAMDEVDRQWYLDKARGDEQKAILMTTMTLEQMDMSDAEMDDFMSSGGFDAVNEDLIETEIMEPQKIVTRTEKANNSALKWGAGGAVAGSYFGPWGTAIGGGAGVLGGAIYDSPLGNTLKNIFKGQDSSGENAYKRGTYESTESSGKRIDNETKGYIESKDPFEQSLQHIDKDLIADTEEGVIPLMEYHFGDYGFVFERADAMGDGMYVYGYEEADDGQWYKKRHYVNLDRLYEKEWEATQLKNFLIDHKSATNHYNEAQKGEAVEKEFKFHDQGQVDRTVKKVTEKENKLRDDIKEYFRQVQDYNNIKHLPRDQPIYITGENGEEIATTPDALLIELKYLHKQLRVERNNLIDIGQQLDRDIGLWYMMSGQQGTASGGFFQNLTAGGGADIGAFGMDLVIDAGVSIAHAIDEDATGGLTPDQMKKQIKLGQDQQDGEGYDRQEASPFSNFANKVTDRMEQEKGMTTGTEAAFDWMTGQESREYINQKMSRQNIYVEDHPFSEIDHKGEDKGWWDWVGNLGFYGAARSIPAMVGPAPVRLLNMGGQVYTHLQKEMAGDEYFDSISEGEKKLFSIPLAAVVGILENLGFRNMKQMNSLSSKILMNVLGKGSKEVSGRTFAQVVKAEVNNMLAQGLIRVGNAGVAEFETGFAQELADIGFKEFYNTVTESDAFATPQSTEEFFGQLMVGATSEMIGGFVIGTPMAMVYAAKDQDFTQVNDDTFKVFEQVHNQQTVKDAFVTKIKEKILSGEMTKSEGDKQIQSYDQISGVMDQIPTDLPLQQKKKLLGNLLRQQELRDYIEKYNKQLTKKQQAELAQLENDVESIIREGESNLSEEAKDKHLTERAMHELINSGVENPTPEQVNQKKAELAKGTHTFTTVDGNTTSTYTVEVTEDHAKKELQKDGIENPTQEQIDAKQAELLKKGREQIEQMDIQDQEVRDRIKKDKGKDYVWTQKEYDNTKELIKKEKTDAIQKSSSTKVDVQVQAQDGGPVGTGNTSGTSTSKSKVESKTDTKSKKKTKVEPETQLDEEVSDLEAAVAEDTGVPVVEQTTEETTEDTPVSETTTTTTGVDVNTETNTVNVTTSEGSTVSLPGGRVSDNVQYTSTDGKGKTTIPQRLLNQAIKAGKAVKKLLPNVNIVLHATEDAYNQAVSQKSRGTRGTFAPATNTIHINSTIATSRTVPHEVMHAVLLKTLGIDSEIQEVTQRMLAAAIKGVKDPKVKKELQEFAKAYETQDQSEEQVAELFAMLANNYTKLDKSSKGTVKRWLQIVASKLGLPTDIVKFTKTDNDIIDFFNTVAGKVRTGEEVEESDVEVITRKPKAKPKAKPKKKSKKESPKEKSAPKYNKTPIVPGHHSMLFNALLKLAGYNPVNEAGMYTDAREHTDLRKTKEGRAVDKFISKIMKESKTYGEALSRLSEGIEILKDYQVSRDVYTDEEIADAYAEQEAEGKALEQQESGLAGLDISYIAQKIHEYFHGITKQDFDKYGDRNWRKGNAALNFLLRRNASPLDGQAQELSELAGVEITEQDFIDYMMDRVNNPGKYTQLKEKNQKAGLDKLIQMYQMNPKGFIGPNVYSLTDLETWAGRLGFGIGKARVRDKNAYDYGRLTGYYLTKNGRMFNPRSKEKNQKVITEKNQKTFNKEDSPIDIINTARDQNFTDAAIRDYLTRVRKFPKREIDKLLKVHDEVLKTIPKSLGNIEGGMNSGLKLYNTVFKKYYQLQRANIKSKIKKSQQEIMDETMDFLRSQPAFKKLNTTGTNVASTQQRVLEIDMARALGGKQSTDLSASIKNSRLILNSKKIGMKELREAQRELRNFLRRVLPKDIYTKSEVTTLIRKISQATPENIQNIQDEILEFAAEKNNIRLEESIEKLLNPKDRIKINNILKGVKIDDATRKRIERIRKRLNPKGGLKTEDKVLEYLAELQKEYNDINENPAKKEADYEALADLQIIMSLINAQNLMDNKDISKVATLSKVESMLKDIIVTGKTLFKEELKKAHLEYRRQFEEVYKDITGRTESFKKQAIRELKEDGIENPTPELIQDKITDIIEGIKQKQGDLNDASNKKNRPTGVALKKRAQNLVNSIVRTLGNIMGQNSDMFSLMDKISKLPAALFEGVTQKEVTEKIDRASRLFKERMLMNEAFIIFKWQELFGKKYKKKVAKFTRSVSTGIYKDADAVQKAQDAYNNNPTPVNQKKLEDAIAQNEQELSPNQMYYLYNQYKDPRNHPGFEKQFGSDYQRVMQEMTDLLTNEYAELKEFADWQVDILFPMLYQHYNQAYKDIYRIDMPYNVNYAGMVYRELGKGDQQDAGIDLLSGTPQYHNTVSSNSTKMRQDNKRAIRKDVDGTNALFTYIRDMEYFAAYARPVSDINKIFTNPIIYDTIKRLYGQETNDMIHAAIDKIANKGMSQSDGKMDQAVNVMQDIFILSRLGINPVVTLKQLTSFVTYGNDIGFVNWMKNAALSRFGKGQSVKAVWKEIAENSVYLQDRQKQSITKAIEAYTDERMIEVMPERFGMSGNTRESLINILMYTTRLGDIGAIYLGGVPNYVFYKEQALKAGKTEKQAIEIAIRKFERDTKRTQQSTDLQDRDYRQNKDAINRALNMFLTTPKQYLRKEVYAIRNLYRLAASGGKQGKGTVGENMRTFITYHVVMPMFFQYVANGFPGLLADWDEEDGSDLMRAGILGNINALFIYGEFVEKFAYYLQDKPKGFLEFKNLPILTQGEEILSKLAAYRDAKDPVKKQEKFYKALREISQITGLPVNNLHKIFTNLEALADGESDPAKIIMRLFNYSEYQINSEEERAEQRKEMMKGVNKRTRERHGTTKKKSKNTKPKSDNPMERVNPMHSENPMSNSNPMSSDNPMLD